MTDWHSALVIEATVMGRARVLSRLGHGYWRSCNRPVWAWPDHELSDVRVIVDEGGQLPAIRERDEARAALARVEAIIAHNDESQLTIASSYAQAIRAAIRGDQ